MLGVDPWALLTQVVTVILIQPVHRLVKIFIRALVDLANVVRMLGQHVLSVLKHLLIVLHLILVQLRPGLGVCLSGHGRDASLYVLI